MISDNLLNRLKKVELRGQNRWMACCPAHDDNEPSLSIKLTEDGRLLLYCFAGCGAANVITALGLSFSDLYPPDQRHHYTPSIPTKQRRSWSWSDLITYLREDLENLSTLTLHLAQGGTLTPTEQNQLFQTAYHLETALKRSQSHA